MAVITGVLTNPHSEIEMFFIACPFSFFHNPPFVWSCLEMPEQVSAQGGGPLSPSGRFRIFSSAVRVEVISNTVSRQLGWFMVEVVRNSAKIVLNLQL